MGKKITDFAIKHPKAVILIVAFILTASLSRITNITVDTDPENMLGKDEWVRVFHNQVKDDFALSDMIVLGVVNEKNANGVFNPETLGKVFRITKGIKKIKGVVVHDLMAPSTVDDILQDGEGSVRFQYLMEAPPTSETESLRIRDRAMANPLLYGTLVSEDGKALAVYIPIEEKDIAHRVGEEIGALASAEKQGDEDYHITGLPIAEDTFGVEMFKQMAISAPIAGLIVFLLMLFFFRKLSLVASPMLVAVLAVIITMGTLIGTGNTLHIMSSMIPIFLMPIAVVDSVHILSVFFDKYQNYKNRELALSAVMEELFTPMLYTSLTTFAGFASLALTPIPPVRVFGLFVAFGVAMAWILTVTLVPAYIMLFIPESKLEGFGASAVDEERKSHTPLAKALMSLGESAREKSKLWLGFTAVIIGISAFGISRIKINDNPVSWFVPSHPIRIADKVLNAHFGGTYEAYLVFETPAGAEALRGPLAEVSKFLAAKAVASEASEVKTVIEKLQKHLPTFETSEAKESNPNPLAVMEKLADELESDIAAIPNPSDALLDELDMLAEGLEDQRTALHVFKNPEILRYIEKLQNHLASTNVVGKSNGLPDVVKKVHQELFEGRKEKFIIPDSAAAVAQCILSFQGSHDPDDVWHLVTPDFRKLNLWVQLKSGDNKEMENVVELVEAYITANPPPIALDHAWAGLTYLNVVWQDKMVKGMLESLLGSFIIVLIMMIFLFRSFAWGLLSMIPLSVTIAFIYGLIGLVGKDYDMPVAVLSSLTLGMSVDFAIHFLERARELYRETGSWFETSKLMAGAPSRAITRNAVVIAVGFTPLLAAPLVPYRTVGFFLAAIMAVSGLGTLMILPSLIQELQNFLFKKEQVQGASEKND